MILQIVFVFMLSQNVFSNTLLFYNPRHHGSLTRKATDDQLGVEEKISDVAVAIQEEDKNLVESQGFDSKSVTLNIYYESLCPDSIDFITKQLYPTWKNLGKYIIPVFKPSGKESFVSNHGQGWNFTCQHGPNECRGNLYQACFLKLHEKEDLDEKVQVINCIMSNQSPDTATLKCMDKIKVETPTKEAVDKCAHSVFGQNVLHDIAVETKSLKPSLNFVPWIVINGEHTEEMQSESLNNLERYLCKNYLEEVTEC